MKWFTMLRLLGLLVRAPLTTNIALQMRCFMLERSLTGSKVVHWYIAELFRPRR